MLKLLPPPSPDRVAEPSVTLDSHGMSASRSRTRATATVPGAVPATVSTAEVVTGATVLALAVGSVDVVVVVGVTAGVTIDDVRNESVGTMRAKSFSALSQFIRDVVTFAMTDSLAAVEA